MEMIKNKYQQIEMQNKFQILIIIQNRTIKNSETK